MLLRYRLPSAVFAPDGDGVAAPAAAEAPAPAPAVEAAPAPAPVEAAPVAPAPAAPAAEAAPAPAPTPDPAAPAPATAEAKAAPEIATSLLEQGATPPAPVEPAGEPPAEEAAPVSTEAPPEGPASYELAFPDDLDPSSVNDERVSTLKSILAESKVPAEKGQELLNLHYEDVRAAQESVYDQMVTAFNEQQAARQAEVKADPQFAARFDTAIVECFQVIDRFGGNEADKAELIAELKASGMGNSLRFLRFLNNAYNSVIREGSPVATPQPRAPAMSREARGLNRYSGQAAR